MRHTIRKWFWAWEFDKEEAWLADLAAQGKALMSVRFATYEFEDCAPGEYITRLEMLENAPGSEESRQYIAFVEDTGAQYIGHIARWVYFRKKAADGPFELHSDNASRRRHLRGIIRVLVPLLFLNLGLGMYNLSIGTGLDSPVNVVCSLLSFALTGLLAAGLYKLNEKKKQLEKNSQLYE